MRTQGKRSKWRSDLSYLEHFLFLRESKQEMLRLYTAFPNRKERHHMNSSKLGVGIAIGVAIGAAIGVAMDNLAVGMGMGIAIGVAIGIAMSSGEPPAKK